MKKTLIPITLVAILLALILTGCGKKAGESYGEPIQNRQIMNLKQVLTEPDSFKDKTLTVEGKIVRLCPTGCWFDIQNETAVVHVDIHPSGFVIPQKSGKTVLVEGTVSVIDGQVEIIGTGVEFQ